MQTIDLQEVAKQWPSMRQVTKYEFFAVINPLNVHPNAEGGSRHKFGMYSEWRMLMDRKLVGLSFGYSRNTVYMLEQTRLLAK